MFHSIRPIRIRWQVAPPRFSSLSKAPCESPAFGLYPRNNSRVPHICLVLADLGYCSPPPQA
jgi:hypothetical protein